MCIKKGSSILAWPFLCREKKMQWAFWIINAPFLCTEKQLLKITSKSAVDEK